MFPDDAYHCAKGEQIDLPVQEGQAPLSAQLERLLDFAVVTDHAEGIGEGYICRNEGEYQG